MGERNRDSVRKLLASNLPADAYSRVTEQHVVWLLENDLDTATMLQNVKAKDLATPPFTVGLRRKIAEVFSVSGLSLSAAIRAW